MAYSPEEIERIFDTVISEIKKGRAVVSILKDDGMPCRDTFDKWLEADQSKIDKYVHACNVRHELIFEDVLKIADTPVEGKTVTIDEHGKTKETFGDMIQHRRLQIDARKWMLGKLNPKKYGDKTINENHNKNENINVELSKEEFKNLSDELDSEY